MSPNAFLFYLFGAAVTVFGIHSISHRSFPRWVQGPLLWPLIKISPMVASMQGWAAVLLGAAVTAFALTPFAPRYHDELFFFVAACGMVSVSLIAYSTWLSRRPEPGAMLRP